MHSHTHTHGLKREFIGMKRHLNREQIDSAGIEEIPSLPICAFISGFGLHLRDTATLVPLCWSHHPPLQATVEVTVWQPVDNILYYRMMA